MSTGIRPGTRDQCCSGIRFWRYQMVLGVKFSNFSIWVRVFILFFKSIFFWVPFWYEDLVVGELTVAI